MSGGEANAGLRQDGGASRFAGRTTAVTKWLLGFMHFVLAVVTLVAGIGLAAASGYGTTLPYALFTGPLGLIALFGGGEVLGVIAPVVRNALCWWLWCTRAGREHRVIPFLVLGSELASATVIAWFEFRAQALAWRDVWQEWYQLAGLGWVIYWSAFFVARRRRELSSGTGAAKGLSH